MNLLLEALELLGTNPVAYFQAVDRVEDGVYFQGGFLDGVPVFQCQVQPVPTSRYEVLGLEMQKDYVQWFVPREIVGLERDSTGDLIEWNGKRWQLQDTTDWSAQDGWMAVVCVAIGDADA